MTVFNTQDVIRAVKAGEITKEEGLRILDSWERTVLAINRAKNAVRSAEVVEESEQVFVPTEVCPSPDDRLHYSQPIAHHKDCAVCRINEDCRSLFELGKERRRYKPP